MLTVSQLSNAALNRCDFRGCWHQRADERPCDLPPRCIQEPQRQGWKTPKRTHGHKLLLYV